MAKTSKKSRCIVNALLREYLSGVCYESVGLGMGLTSEEVSNLKEAIRARKKTINDSCSSLGTNMALWSDEIRIEIGGYDDSI